MEMFPNSKGHLAQQTSSAYVVSLIDCQDRSIPANAPICVFFDDAAEAEAFAQLWNLPPIMAVLKTIDQYIEQLREAAALADRRRTAQEIYKDPRDKERNHIWPKSFLRH